MPVNISTALTMEKKITRGTRVMDRSPNSWLMGKLGSYKLSCNSGSGIMSSISAKLSWFGQACLEIILFKEKVYRRHTKTVYKSSPWAQMSWIIWYFDPTLGGDDVCKMFWLFDFTVANKVSILLACYLIWYAKCPYSETNIFGLSRTGLSEI